ncbi:MAG: MBOAT family protein [Flavobacteriales bacterium]|nr:MBOAT family protein [Flavobacteriales bacterium]
MLLYYLLPHRTRWILLLAASYIFYGYWKVEYLSLILASTTVDYFVARYIHSTPSRFHKRFGLALSLITNLGLLVFFKYSGWFIEDVLDPVIGLNEVQLNDFRTAWDFLLPVGISFYTFQTLGYTIDVYYGKAVPEKNPLKFALFVSYFPQLVAGPIERFSHLHQQLFQRVSFQYSNLQHGARLILYGLFIKMCVADNVSPVVDQIFGHSTEADSLQLVIGMLLFGLQIYSDFHGYSLIAIGTAKLMGVNLMGNFNAPYTALSIREFWSRWHISLSTWFRDYLFIPLGGSKAGQVKLGINILIVFLVSGLWHGANWTFVVWGAMHGVAYLIERWVLPERSSRIGSALKWIWTMVIVFVAWIFFRSESIEFGAAYVGLMISNMGEGITLEWDPFLPSIVGIFILSDLLFRNRSIHVWLESKSTLIRWSVYALLLFFITGFAGTIQHPFIYFQF